MLTVNLDKACHDLGNTAAGRTDYRVFTCLTEYMNSEGVAAIPQSLLSKETGFKRRTTSNSVKRLKEKGFLTIERNMTEHGGIATNMYHINPRYLTETKPVEQSKTKTRSRVQETQMTAPGCVNLEEALLELGSDGANEKSKKIFALLARHADQNGEARVLLHDITTETHISAKVVQNEIGFLIHNGFLKVSKEFVNTDTTHYYRNVYTIDSRFLRDTPAACYSTVDFEKRTTQCSAYAKPCSDVRRLARLGEVLADVVKNLLQAYENEEKNK